VRGAEDRVQIFGVGRCQIDAQQQALHFGEQFFCFVEKDLVKLADVDAHGDVRSWLPKPKFMA
jgi:hypothetical protein